MCYVRCGKRLFARLIGLSLFLSPIVPAFGSTHANPAEEIIGKMHKKWHGKWPRNMKFEEHVYYYKDGKVVKEDVWQEIMNCPQNLHIRFGGFDTGNGALFRNDSVYNFAQGRLSKKGKSVHHLLLLGYDVYHQAPELTLAKAKSLGFDFSKSCRTKRDGRKVIVVGTNNADDQTMSQFWVDEKELYLIRVVQVDGGQVSDVVFGNFRTIDNVPTATEVIFTMNNKLAMVEKYFNISYPDKVDQGIFEVANFNTARW